MATYWHSLESGQGSGTTVTAGNSAVGGTPFNTITAGTGAGVTYNSTAYRGSLSLRCTTGGTSSQASATWTSTTITAAMARVYGRAVVRRAAGPAGTAIVRLRGGGTQVARITWDGSGRIELRNTSNSILATSSAAAGASDWWLVRWDITVGASAAGVVHVHTDPTTATPAETLSIGSANFGTTSVDEAGWGNVAAGSNVDIRLDDILISDAGLPGPPAQAVTISETISLGDAIARGLLADRSVAETLAVADSPGRVLALARQAAETLTVADNPGRVLVLARPVGETLTVVDTIARSILASRPVAETLTVTDAPSRGLVLARTVAEPLSFADSSARAVTAGRAVAETLTLADAATAVVAAAPSSGTVTRPSLGTVGRPAAGTVTRPDAGVVTRP